MRIVLSLIILLASVGRASARATSTDAAPILLSYSELMRLSSAERIAYLREVGELLAVMEEQFQDRFEIASRTNPAEFRSRVALLMQMAEFLPEAQAESAAVDYASIKPTWDGKGYRCGDEKSVRFYPRLGTCAALQFPAGPGDDLSYRFKGCSKGTQGVPAGYTNGSGYYCIPEASWYLLGQANQQNLKDRKDPGFKTMTPDQQVAYVGVPQTKEPKPVQAVTDGQAPSPAPGAETNLTKCEPPQGDARRKLVLEFRRSDAKRCIAGGFFTKKKPGPITKASCEKKYVFPDKKIDGLQMSCEKNQVLCNPAIFCLQLRDVAIKGRTDKVDVLQSTCVKDSPFITRSCNERFKAQIGTSPRGTLKGMADAKNKTFEACDPATVKSPLLTQGFLENFKALKTETENMYAAHCTGNDKQFLPLFCEECRIVGERLKGMPKPAEPSEPPAPQPAQTPAQPAGPSDTAR